MQLVPMGVVSPSVELQRLFSVPFPRLRWPDSTALNSELIELVRAKACSDRGIKVSNVAGWHSAKDLHLWDAPCVKRSLSSSGVRDCRSCR